jgi:hypothetical protein
MENIIGKGRSQTVETMIENWTFLTGSVLTLLAPPVLLWNVSRQSALISLLAGCETLGALLGWLKYKHYSATQLSCVPTMRSLRALGKDRSGRHEESRLPRAMLRDARPDWNAGHPSNIPESRDADSPRKGLSITAPQRIEINKVGSYVDGMVSRRKR